jgi:hypothetical protein
MGSQKKDAEEQVANGRKNALVTLQAGFNRSRRVRRAARCRRHVCDSACIDARDRVARPPEAETVHAPLHLEKRDVPDVRLLHQSARARR